MLLEGPNQVAATIRVEIGVRDTDREIDDLGVHLWTFDYTGRITALRHIVDTHQHVKAAAARALVRTADRHPGWLGGPLAPHLGAPA